VYIRHAGKDGTPLIISHMYVDALFFYVYA